MGSRSVRTHAGRTCVPGQRDGVGQGAIRKEETQGRTLDLQGVGAFVGSHLLLEIGTHQLAGMRIELL